MSSSLKWVLKLFLVICVVLSANLGSTHCFAQQPASPSAEYDFLINEFSQITDRDLKILNAEMIEKLFMMTQSAGTLLFIKSDLTDAETLLKAQKLMEEIGNKLVSANEAFVNYDIPPWQNTSWTRLNHFEKTLQTLGYASAALARDLMAAFSPLRWRRDATDPLISSDRITWPRRTPLYGRDWQRTRMTVTAFKNLTTDLAKRLNDSKEKSAELELRLQAALPLIHSLENMEPRQYKNAHKVAKLTIFTVGFLVSYVFLPEFAFELTSDSPAISAAIWTTLFSYLYVGRNMNSGYKTVILYENLVRLIQSKGYELKVKSSKEVRSAANTFRRSMENAEANRLAAQQDRELSELDRYARSIRCAAYFGL